MDLEVEDASEDVEAELEYLTRNGGKYGGVPPHAPQNSTVAIAND